MIVEGYQVDNQNFNRIPLGDKIEYQYAWLVFAMIHVVFLVPMVMLRFYGVRWRNSAWQKPPTFHDDI